MLLRVPVVYLLYCCIVFHYMKRQFTYPFSFFFPFLATFIQHIIGSLSHSSYIRQKEKKSKWERKKENLNNLHMTLYHI